MLPPWTWISRKTLILDSAWVLGRIFSRRVWSRMASFSLRFSLGFSHKIQHYSLRTGIILKEVSSTLNIKHWWALTIITMYWDHQLNNVPHEPYFLRSASIEIISSDAKLILAHKSVNCFGVSSSFKFLFFMCAASKRSLDIALQHQV